MTRWSTRRDLLIGGAVAGAAAAVPRQAAAQAPQRPTPIDVSDPAENLRQIIRVFGDAAGGDVLYWFHGHIRAMLPDRRPLTLVHVTGINAMRFTRLADGSYESRHHSVSFMEDAVTQELLTEFRNPITGRTNRPKSNVFSGSEYVYDRAGTRMKGEPAATATPFHPGMWSFNRDNAWVTIDRPYAARFGHPWSESRTYSVSMSELQDRRLTSLPSRQHSTVTNPYPEWMAMPATAGFALWHVTGRKLTSVAELPQHLQDRCERSMPQLKLYDVF